MTDHFYKLIDSQHDTYHVIHVLIKTTITTFSY
jgi:hypothetical protein